MIISVIYGSIAIIVLCLVAMIILSIKIRRINKNHALFEKMMDEKEKNTFLFYEFLRQNQHRYFVNPMLILQDPQPQEFINKDENLIFQICKLGKIYENINKSRLNNVLIELVLYFNSIYGNVSGISKNIFH
ncbi:MAG: hypothetical protein A3J46_04460 [Candidatus Yanofskybacteria bacterium RIFCSPHIGHO2_02_FULL_41_11]|uniref:Uncharacterized protein n=1 Tax=Candidatus Yanofskybacteria bacterium RIFCSPHIGHO2_02_FULL_41_11 TaxID=1802675 RepID=A0A1F8F9V0_9BACT|nr:MAG: hypothetical protein A3J46_04460 [Candidatus Yanofskybacteria bacterium RIFCSPHIGHO2_02_FULL_41_11]